MRVGVLAHGFMGWGGGIDFLRNFISSLHQADSSVEIHLLAPLRGPRVFARRQAASAYQLFRNLVGKKGSLSASFATHHLEELETGCGCMLAIHEIDSGVYAIRREASRLRLDVLAPAFLPLPHDFPVPWVGYVYDFQHKYYPDLFSAADIKHRDKAFATMLTRASAVVVNSQSVATDIAHFHPQAKARVFPLPFNAAPQPAWLEVSPQSAQQRYGITRPYFIICNQFWKHKDHATAFDAFSQFARAEPNVDLVCTGTPHDYRFPDYVASLKARLTESGLAERVRILGSIPKLDQIGLLKGSVALIQPTLFEGGPGGGAVFDAVSLGVPSIVSNIPTNLEISDSSLTFFPAGSVQGLSTAILRTRARSARVEVPSINDLRIQGMARQRLSGAAAFEAISFARSQSEGATR